MLEAEGLRGEIVIGDNGSTDRSRELATELGCRVVDCSKRGYGFAVVEGSRQAYGRYILMGDSDGSYDFREGVPMVLKLHREGYDLFNGNRFTGNILPGAMPWKNQHIGNPILSGILNFLYRSGLGDAHCGLRAFTREALIRMNICTGGMEFASEIIIKATLMEMKRGEMPITLHKDCRNRPPNLRPYRDGLRHLGVIMTYAPGFTFGWPCVLFLLCGFLMACVGCVVTPYTSGIALLAAGLQCAFLGICAMSGYVLACEHLIHTGLTKVKTISGIRPPRPRDHRIGPIDAALGYPLGITPLFFISHESMFILYALFIFQVLIVHVGTGFLLQLILDRPPTGDTRHGKEVNE
jgi:hypothetical protein